MIATPVLDQRGPFSTYSDIDRTVRNLNPPTTLTLQDVSVVSPREKLVRSIKKAFAFLKDLWGLGLAEPGLTTSFVSSNKVLTSNHESESGRYSQEF